MGWLRKGTDEDLKVDNLIAAGTTIQGVIKARGNVRIDGGIEGELSSDGHVLVGKGAEVRASLSAQSAQVAGVVHGDIRVERRLEILQTGRVWGDVQVGSLQIAEGGLLRGACVMSGEEKHACRRREDREPSDEGTSVAAEQ